MFICEIDKIKILEFEANTIKILIVLRLKNKNKNA